MNLTHILKIQCGADEAVYDHVVSVLGPERNPVPRARHPLATERSWTWCVEEGPEDPHFRFMHEFTAFLRPHMEDLLSFGVTPSLITVWQLYEYDGQCNMEFGADGLKQLADLGIKLCVSCWDSGKMGTENSGS